MKQNEAEKQHSKEEDHRIIRYILLGDVDAFAILEKKYRDLIRSLVYKIIKNEDDCREVTQIAFIKAYTSLKSFDFNYRFSSWLYKIASNSCIDFLRKKQNSNISISNIGANAEETEDYEIPDDSYLPDTNILKSEEKKIIQDAINKLPPKYKEIIILRHYDELNYDDISKRMEIPLGTVKVNLFRARKILELTLRNQINYT